LKIFRPGFPIVDDSAPVTRKDVASENPTVAEAMRLAEARHTQVLNYGRKQAPLVDKSADTPSGTPHAVNDKPEVEK
jgi:hypothetical protein